MRGFRLYLLTLLCGLLLGGASCSRSIDRGVEITSIEVVGLKGFTSLEIDLGVDNSSRLNIKAQGATITIKRDGKSLIKGELLEEVTFAKRSSDIYRTRWAISASSIFGIMGAGADLLNSSSMEGYTIDYRLEGRAGVFSRTLNERDIPIESLIK